MVSWNRCGGFGLQGGVVVITSALHSEGEVDEVSVEPWMDHWTFGTILGFSVSRRG